MESLFHVGEKVIVKIKGTLPHIGEVVRLKDDLDDSYPIVVKLFDKFLTFTDAGESTHSDTAPSLFKLTKENIDAMNTLYGTNLKAPMTPNDICKAMLERGDVVVVCYASDISYNRARHYAADGNISTATISEVFKGSNDSDIFKCRATDNSWKYVIPINTRTGKEITEQDLEN